MNLLVVVGNTYLASLNVLGLNMPAMKIPVLVMPPSFDYATTVPMELFTRRYSITFTCSSITFGPKKEGRIPYAPVPGIVEPVHDAKWPTFDNTPGFIVSIGSHTFAALYDTGAQSLVSLTPHTANAVGLTLGRYPKAEMEDTSNANQRAVC